jgi:hypothetical protein
MSNNTSNFRKTNAAQLTRRQALRRTACGFGYLALAGLTSRAGSIITPARTQSPQIVPRAKRVIFIFMQGGPSHIDTFDYKPALERHDGAVHTFDDARIIANTGQRATPQRVMKGQWKFARHGQSGRWVSELFPLMARHVDDLCLSIPFKPKAWRMGQLLCFFIAAPQVLSGRRWVPGSLMALAPRTPIYRPS